MAAAWLPALGDAAYRAQERLFWRTVAARYAHDPTIFAYDLQNEPFVSEANQPDIVGPEFGSTGYHFGSTITRNLQVPWQAWVHARYGSEAALAAAWGTAYPATPAETWNNLLLDPGPAGNLARRRDGIDFRGEHAAAWAADLRAAVRSVDPNHLVTVAVGARSARSTSTSTRPTSRRAWTSCACTSIHRATTSTSWSSRCGRRRSASRS